MSPISPMATTAVETNRASRNTGTGDRDGRPGGGARGAAILPAPRRRSASHDRSTAVHDRHQRACRIPMAQCAEPRTTRLRSYEAVRSQSSALAPCPSSCRRTPPSRPRRAGRRRDRDSPRPPPRRCARPTSRPNSSPSEARSCPASRRPSRCASRSAIGWHTYWQNPGDSGLPTTLAWKLPPGVTAGPIQWPAPKALPVGPLINHGYEGEVFHLVDVAVPADAPPGQTAHARAPGPTGWSARTPAFRKARTLSLTLPVARAAAIGRHLGAEDRRHSRCAARAARRLDGDRATARATRSSWS